MVTRRTLRENKGDSKVTALPYFNTRWLGNLSKEVAFEQMCEPSAKAPYAEKLTMNMVKIAQAGCSFPQWEEPKQQQRGLGT